MSSLVKNFIEEIKTNTSMDAYNQASVNQAIILPLLQLLGWNTYNVNEVTPQFSFENKRMAYLLKVDNCNRVLIEIINSEDFDSFENIFLDVYKLGIELGILTNGKTWCFYLFPKKGENKLERFYVMDICNQDSKVVSELLVDLLSKNNVQMGKSILIAELTYRKREKLINIAISKAWNKILTESNTFLLNLLSEEIEQSCGFKPKSDEIIQFLKNFIINSKQESEPSLIADTKITQDKLVHYIVFVLQKCGGRARKDEVEKEIYGMLKQIFQSPYYQEPVAHGIPRWQHNIAWAKERAKHRGLIKRPEDSGKGYWELTPEGIKMLCEI